MHNSADVFFSWYSSTAELLLSVARDTAVVAVFSRSEVRKQVREHSDKSFTNGEGDVAFSNAFHLSTAGSLRSVTICTAAHQYFMSTADRDMHGDDE